MIIELSNKKIIEGATTVWYEHGPEVDIVMDLKKLSFKPGSVEKIYSFHVLDHFFEGEVLEAVKNWRDCLKDNGSLFCITDNFEYVSRMLIGGEVDMNTLNANFSHPMHFSQDNLVEYMKKTGFVENKMVIWGAPDFMDRQEFELVIEGKK